MCGIVGYIPTIVKDVTKTLLEPFNPDIHTSSESLLNCHNEIFEVRSDGMVTISDSEGNIVMSLKGDVCTPTAKDCINGLVLQDPTKTIKIGTKIVKTGTYFYSTDDEYSYNKNIALSPWPFVEEPKLKFKRQRS